MDYEIIGEQYVGAYKHYKVRCKICGHTKLMQKANYETSISLNALRHGGVNCKDDYYNEFIGKQYGDWTVIRRVKNRRYEIQCTKCGTRSEVNIESLLRNKGFAHGVRCFKALPDDEYKTTIAFRFNDMKQRCENSNNNNYKHYGARGIKCKYDFAVDLYYDFINELREHSRIYGIRNSSFDRIDVNGHYEKSNLRIATQSIQSTNTTRKQIFIIEKDGKRVISDSAMYAGRCLGINGRSLGNVVRGASKSSNGWKLYRLVDSNENIDEVIHNEGVTTNMITT